MRSGREAAYAPAAPTMCPWAKPPNKRPQRRNASFSRALDPANRIYTPDFGLKEFSMGVGGVGCPGVVRVAFFFYLLGALVVARQCQWMWIVGGWL